ncbi:MAG: dephospho-CoA kinase [Burkholderiales bacterium]
MPLKIGLTGGIGCGKSTAAAMFKECGTDVIDTDAIAHRLTAPGTQALKTIAATFGADYVLPDGSLDRARLRQRVFNDARDRATLEAMLHPLIRRQVQTDIAASLYPYAVIVVPLLLETDFHTLVDRVLVVDCDDHTQIERGVARGGLSLDTVRAIMAAQLARPERLRRADDVLNSQGSLDSLRSQVEILHQNYLMLARYGKP